jgi:hypothetical protein
MFDTSRFRVAAASLVGLAVTASMAFAPGAVADPGRGPAICQPSVQAGVEVDTCTGNPNARNDSGPGDVVRVVPRFCVGIGFVGCDDD